MEAVNKNDEGSQLGPRIGTFDGMSCPEPRPRLPRWAVGLDVSPINCECGNLMWVECKTDGLYRCPFCDEIVHASANEVAASSALGNPPEAEEKTDFTAIERTILLTASVIVGSFIFLWIFTKLL
jgi:hypothetical protein